MGQQATCCHVGGKIPEDEFGAASSSRPRPRCFKDCSGCGSRPLYVGTTELSADDPLHPRWRQKWLEYEEPNVSLDALEPDKCGKDANIMADVGLLGPSGRKVAFSDDFGGADRCRGDPEATRSRGMSASSFMSRKSYIEAMLGIEEQMERHMQQSMPLRVLPTTELERIGHLPRSSACVATLPDGSLCGQRHDDVLTDVGDGWDLLKNPIVMISHSWVEPSKGRPDNDDNRKWQIVLAGIRRVCDQHNLDPECMYVFLDWCSIPQEAFGTPEFDQYVQSLPAFIAQMSFVIIPLDSKLVLRDALRLDRDLCPVQMNWAHYSKRGWCRMEMLVGRALEALGTELRVYRFDATWGPGKERLIEVPPYTPGSLGIMPTASDALYTCCQRDHWDAHSKSALRCDRTAIRSIEQLFSSEVMTVINYRRLLFLNIKPGLLEINPELQGIVVVPAVSFLQMGGIPRFGEGHNVVLQDHDLVDKRIFYFSNRFWRPGLHPDNESGLKMRWMKKVLRMLCERDGIDISCVYIWQDYSSIDQDDKTMKALGWDAIPGLVARSTYFVVFATDEQGNSEGALDRAWIRRSVFVSRLLSSLGIYTATYMTKLSDLNSLFNMTLKPLQSCKIDPATYASGKMEQNLEGSYSHQDPLCPWTGKLTDENDRDIIRRQCLELLEAAAEMPQDHDLRKRMVRRANRLATATFKSSRNLSDSEELASDIVGDRSSAERASDCV